MERYDHKTHSWEKVQSLGENSSASRTRSSIPDSSESRNFGDSESDQLSGLPPRGSSAKKPIVDARVPPLASSPNSLEQQLYSAPMSFSERDEKSTVTGPISVFESTNSSFLNEEYGGGGGGDPVFAEKFGKTKRKILILFDELRMPKTDRGYYSAWFEECSKENYFDMLALLRSLLRHKEATLCVLKAIMDREMTLRTIEALVSQKPAADRGPVRSKLLQEFISLQCASLAVVDAVAMWRDTMNQPFPFYWNQTNYLMKMKTDLVFLDAADHASSPTAASLSASQQTHVVEDLTSFLKGMKFRYNPLLIGLSAFLKKKSSSATTNGPLTYPLKPSSKENAKRPLGISEDRLRSAEIIVMEEDATQQMLRKYIRSLKSRNQFIPVLRVEGQSSLLHIPPPSPLPSDSSYYEPSTATVTTTTRDSDTASSFYHTDSGTSVTTTTDVSYSIPRSRPLSASQLSSAPQPPTMAHKSTLPPRSPPHESPRPAISHSNETAVPKKEEKTSTPRDEPKKEPSPRKEKEEEQLQQLQQQPEEIHSEPKQQQPAPAPDKPAEPTTTQSVAVDTVPTKNTTNEASPAVHEKPTEKDSQPSVGAPQPEQPEQKPQDKPAGPSTPPEPSDISKQEKQPSSPRPSLETKQQPPIEQQSPIAQVNAEESPLNNSDKQESSSPQMPPPAAPLPSESSEKETAAQVVESEKKEEKETTPDKAANEDQKLETKPEEGDVAEQHNKESDTKQEEQQPAQPSDASQTNTIFGPARAKRTSSYGKPTSSTPAAPTPVPATTAAPSTFSRPNLSSRPGSGKSTRPFSGGASKPTTLSPSGQDENDQVRGSSPSVTEPPPVTNSSTSPSNGGEKPPTETSTKPKEEDKQPSVEAPKPETATTPAPAAQVSTPTATTAKKDDEPKSTPPPLPAAEPPKEQKPPQGESTNEKPNPQLSVDTKAPAAVETKAAPSPQNPPKTPSKGDGAYAEDFENYEDDFDA